MPTLTGLVLPPPGSWDEFEESALSAAKLRWNSTDLYRHGRQGQRQDGVDIFGMPLMGGISVSKVKHRGRHHYRYYSI
ncbi:hypothetical protein [Methylocella sp.]|uniref:hypothetical protein n=1 Tax=Methylocella sp. TaxID=1978226 RepID=UPI0037831B09